MANVATAQTAIQMAMSSGQQGFSQVTPIVCTFDTLATDLTIFTPSIATNYGAIIGMLYQDASAHTITFTSGTTAYVTLERTTYDGIGLPLGTGGFLFVGARGAAIKIQCGTALISTMLIHCVEFPSLNFNNR